MVASVRPERNASASSCPFPPSASGKHPVARDGVVALLAHDLNTPLAAISMNLDFVLAEMKPGESSNPIRAALEDCRDANARAIGILSDMTDAARLASGERQAILAEVDLHALLSGTARAASDAAARDVRVVWSVDASSVRADPDLLGRAFERLFERALRHARAGGHIEVALRDRTISIRVASCATNEADVSPLGGAVRGLAMLFADAAMRAQGGAAWTESDSEGALVFCLNLP
ncbi:MAG: HAMP domain-containing histidine kinase [Myxococcota bacterium]|nr:HAMP domain-containing histidine kinase [Myxococcota bacterium]